MVMLTALWSEEAFAEKIHFKDGKVIEGKIVKMTDSAVEVEVSSGTTIPYAKESIAHIEASSPPETGTKISETPPVATQDTKVSEPGPIPDPQEIVTKYERVNKAIRTIKAVAQTTLSIEGLTDLEARGEGAGSADAKRYHASYQVLRHESEFAKELFQKERQKVLQNLNLKPDQKQHLLQLLDINVVEQEMRRKRDIYFTETAVLHNFLGSWEKISGEETAKGVAEFWNMLGEGKITLVDLFISERPEDLVTLASGRLPEGKQTAITEFANAEIAQVLLEGKECYLVRQKFGGLQRVAKILQGLLDTPESLPTFQDNLVVTDFISEQWIDSNSYFLVRDHVKGEGILKRLTIQSWPFAELVGTPPKNENVKFLFENTVDFSDHNLPIEITIPPEALAAATPEQPTSTHAP